MIDLSLVGALLWKEGRERRTQLNSDLSASVAGGIIRVALAAAFLYFFGKFAAVYCSIGEGEERLFELSALSLTALFVSLILGAVSALGKAFYARELALYAAMPVSHGTLFFARLLSAYLSGVVFCVPALLLIGGALSFGTTLPAAFWRMAVPVALFLPLLAVGAAALLAPVGNAVLRFFAPRFLWSLFFVTLLAAAGFFGYSRLLAAVKELLLGDELRYFFNENVLNAIGKAVRVLFPANALAALLVGRPVGTGGAIGLASLPLLLGGATFLVCRRLLARAMRREESRPPVFRSIPRMGRRSPFGAFLSAAFYRVLRSPAEAFSCFSLALLFPLMVLSCMAVGASLVEKLVGLDCSAELALFLTLLFSALTNLFCASCISQEGGMLFCVRAMPVGAGTYFAAKAAFCLCVALPSQALSAALLPLAGVSLRDALFVFAAGSLFALAQICFALRCDFNRFSRYGTGKGTETAVILAGLLSALPIGGGAFALRLFLTLRLSPSAGVPLFAAGGAGLILAGLALLYLLAGLKRRFETLGGAR